MDTYIRGEWGKDNGYPDDWSITDDELSYEGYEKLPGCLIGNEHRINMAVYDASDDNAGYEFFTCVSLGHRSWSYLVKDFPSLLMLAREILPLINDERERDLHEMKREEHKRR